MLFWPSWDLRVSMTSRVRLTHVLFEYKRRRKLSLVFHRWSIMPQDTSYSLSDLTINQDGIFHKDFQLTTSNSLWKASMQQPTTLWPEPGNHIEVKGYFRNDVDEDYQKFQFKITDDAGETVLQRLQDFSPVNVSRPTLFYGPCHVNKEARTRQGPWKWGEAADPKNPKMGRGFHG